MKTIRIGRDTTAEVFVDDEDYEWLNDLHFHLIKSRGTSYAQLNDSNTYMHHLVLLIQFGLRKDSPVEVDHINGNGLDNQRSNLRIVSKRKNAMNRHYRNSREFYRATSQYSQNGFGYSNHNLPVYGFPKRRWAAMARDMEIWDEFGSSEFMVFKPDIDLIGIHERN